MAYEQNMNQMPWQQQQVQQSQYQQPQVQQNQYQQAMAIREAIEAVNRIR